MAPQKGDVRLFDNALLERLSKISPVTVLCVYSPLILLSAWKSFTVGVGVTEFALLFVAGIAFWTLFEYVFHRYVFHFTPRGAFQERISFLFHGVHHQYPNDKKRLVMPITLSLLIAALLLLLFKAILAEWVWGFWAGFMLGYLVYDMMHYSIHHFRPPPVAWIKRIWKSHIDHHFRDSNKGYGVSSPIWDHVFGTLPASRKK
jgi:sterol desaturase/sphingolipid hydroxylase (fatty acid hydroxylase superfamily)